MYGLGRLSWWPSKEVVIIFLGPRRLFHHLSGILDVGGYHGRHARPPFFEGWYVKLVDGAAKNVMAIIPGIHLHLDAGQSHAFVQLLHGDKGESHYVRYPLEQFAAAVRGWDIRIGDNHFRSDGMHLEVKDGDDRWQGDLVFRGLTPWPVRWHAPGVMGWYAWMPFMECYHGVLSLDHEIVGSLAINDRRIDFSGGRGYCEKDWGRSFPQAYIWMQCNHFATKGTSVTASAAIIPWLRKSSFLGFIIGFRHQGILYRFTTYTGARIERLAIDDEKVRMTVSDQRFRLQITAERGKGGLLCAPTATGMTTRIAESLNGKIQLQLHRCHGRQEAELFCGSGQPASVEAVGEVSRLAQQ